MDELRSELDDAMTVWGSGDRSDYSYVYLRTCECVRPEPQGPNTVFVVDDEVLAIEHFGLREFLDGFTAAELFAKIGQAIDEGKQIAAVFDPVSGFPVSLNLDLNARPGTDPLILNLHSFLSYADARTELLVARAKWDAADLDDYRFRYETTDAGVVEAKVSDGDFVSDLIGTSTAERRTVTALFDEIDAAIEQRPDTLGVLYHATLGHPMSYQINLNLSQRGSIDVRSIRITP